MRRSSEVDGRVSLVRGELHHRESWARRIHAPRKYSGVSSRGSFQTMVGVPSADAWLGSPFEVER